MPASTLQINLDKTYNIVLFKGLSNGEYINNMKGLGGPVILYRLCATVVIAATCAHVGLFCEFEDVSHGARSHLDILVIFPGLLLVIGPINVTEQSTVASSIWIYICCRAVHY